MNRRDLATDRPTSVFDMTTASLWTPIASYIREITGDVADRIPRASDARALELLLSETA